MKIERLEEVLRYVTNFSDLLKLMRVCKRMQQAILLQKVFDASYFSFSNLNIFNTCLSVKEITLNADQLLEISQKSFKLISKPSIKLTELNVDSSFLSKEMKEQIKDITITTPCCVIEELTNVEKIKLIINSVEWIQNLNQVLKLRHLKKVSLYLNNCGLKRNQIKDMLEIVSRIEENIHTTVISLNNPNFVEEEIVASPLFKRAFFMTNNTDTLLNREMTNIVPLCLKQAKLQENHKELITICNKQNLMELEVSFPEIFDGSIEELTSLSSLTITESMAMNRVAVPLGLQSLHLNTFNCVVSNYKMLKLTSLEILINKNEPPRKTPLCNGLKKLTTSLPLSIFQNYPITLTSISLVKSHSIIIPDCLTKFNLKELTISHCYCNSPESFTHLTSLTCLAIDHLMFPCSPRKEVFETKYTRAECYPTLPVSLINLTIQDMSAIPDHYFDKIKTLRHLRTNQVRGILPMFDLPTSLTGLSIIKCKTESTLVLYHLPQLKTVELIYTVGIKSLFISKKMKNWCNIDYDPPLEDIKIFLI